MIMRMQLINKKLMILSKILNFQGLLDLFLKENILILRKILIANKFLSYKKGRDMLLINTLKILILMIIYKLVKEINKKMK